MSYGWGIDVGVGSIALAVVQLDGQGQATRLIDGQVRIFPAATGGSERRGYRSSRTQNQRRSDRLSRLRASLARYLGVAETVDAEPADRTVDLPAGAAITDRVHLRALGLTEALSAADLARAILHLARNRGRRLTRGLADKDKEKDEDKRADGKSIAEVARDTKNTLEALGRELGLDRAATPGQLLFRDLLAGRPTRLRKDREDAPIFTRGQVAEELSRLLAAQAPHHPVLSEEKVVKEIEAQFAWEQDPPDPRIGFCRYGLRDSDGEVERRLARATDLAETKRIYEALNNIRLRDRSTGSAAPLTLAQRDTLAEHALAGETVTAKRLRTWLKLGTGALALRSSLDEAKSAKGRKAETEIEGHRFASLFKSAFEKRPEDNPWPRADPARREVIAEILRDDDLESVEARLAVEAGIDPGPAAEIARGKPPPVGYTAAGKTATAKLLAQLKAEVISLHEAEQRCDFDSLEDPDLPPGDPLPYYGLLFPLSCVGGTGHPKDPLEIQYGRIPNPVVHMALNQLRLLAKAMLKRHGKPARIHVELARDLNKSAEEREKIDKTIATNRKNNLAWAETLMAHGGRPDRKTLRAIKLHELQGGKCLYSGEAISIDDIVRGNAEVDHILPRSKTMDDGLGNLALVKTQLNKMKGDRTPYQAFGAGEAGRDYAQIMKHVEDCRKPCLPRFAKDALEKFEGPEAFPSRFLADTRYIAKMTRKYLSHLLEPVEGRDAAWRDVVCLSGGLTAKLRYEWGLSETIKILMLEEGRLDPKLIEPLDDPKEEIARRKAMGKIRWDHRHHLVDAIVAACVTRGHVQTINTTLGGKRHPMATGQATSPPQSFPERAGFRETVLDFLRGRAVPGDAAPPPTRVTHKPDHGTAGRLHAETFYSVICEAPGRPGQYVAASHQDLLAKLDPKALREQMILKATVIEAIETAIADGSVGAYGWGGPNPGAALAELRKSRGRLIEAFDAALAAQPTADSAGKAIGGQKRLAAALAELRKSTGQRRFKRYEVVTLSVLEGPERPGRAPRRAVAPGGNDRLVYWLTRGETLKEKVQVVSKLEANTPGFRETWIAESGLLLFRARQGDTLELLENAKDPSSPRKLYRVSSFSGTASGVDLELTPIEESRSAQEVRKWKGKRLSLRSLVACAPRLVVLDPDGRVRWRSASRN